MAGVHRVRSNGCKTTGLVSPERLKVSPVLKAGLPLTGSCEKIRSRTVLGGWVFPLKLPLLKSRLNESSR